ncbi:mechanosensitive ion channel family protein [Roseovarius sp. D0-M9]|uniref:mechanosensitive ion channel family protein n=1 Tax=Roseovarius sp. D0-M9 TaxID=3127117 RepID=UPI0030104CF3
MLVITAPVAAQDDPPLWYPVETINSGLGPAPSELDRSSPRAALRSFVDLIDAGDVDDAAHLLNVSHLPKDEQEARASTLATKLGVLMDRKLRIDWSGTPAEADAKPTTGANASEAPQPRRDYLLEELNGDDQIYAIRLTRYATEPAEGEAAKPVWLFSQDTVDNIDALYDTFGPRAFEAYIPEAMKARVGWLQLWEWLALPLLIGVLILVGRVTAKLVGLGRHLSDNRVVDRVIERAALPLALVVASFAAYWLLGFIVSLSGPATAVITPALVMLAVVGFSLAALRAVDALLDHVTRRQLGDKFDTPSSTDREFFTSMYALRRVILVITVGFSLVFVLMQFDIFANMGMTLLASAGVLTVILGIAGQVTLGNMVASLQIAIAKPVRIGDNIHYEGDWCTVEAIYFTFIRLRTWDERRLIVPVKYFLSYPFKNWSVLNERMLVSIRLVLDPMAKVALLREKFTTSAQADPGVIEHDKIWTAVTDHSAHGMTVEFYVMTPDPWTAWTVEMRLREEMVDFVRNEHPEWWWRERIEL